MVTDMARSVTSGTYLKGRPDARRADLGAGGCHARKRDVHVDVGRIGGRVRARAGEEVPGAGKDDDHGDDAEDQAGAGAAFADDDGVVIGMRIGHDWVSFVRSRYAISGRA